MKTKLALGVGINDAKYQTQVYAGAKGQQRRVWVCPFYRVWMDMLFRCYSEKFKDRHATYIGCAAAPEWYSFSVFREWMAAQDWEGKQLDKDILSQGNKLYSPGSCVFVSAKLNTFMTDSGAARGEWPLGVHWNKVAGKFQARCRNPFTGERQHLGHFGDPLSAHEAWRKRKHQHACAYADQQTDPRIAQALRTRYMQKKGQGDE